MTPVNGVYILAAPRFKISTSQIAALVLAVAFVLYFVVRGLGGDAADSAGQADAAAAAADAPRRTPEVIVRTVEASDHAIAVVARARTEAARAVVTRSETAGRVVAAPAAEGADVKKGDLLCQLEVDARAAALAQANAQLESARLDYDAAMRLAEKGHRSATQVAQAKAAFDAAEAARKSAAIERANVDVRAPFDGRFDKRDAEIGDYLAPGAACGMVVELDPILIVADLSERDLGKLTMGAVGQARLATGEVIEGQVRFISARADESTGTFRVELISANPDGDIRAGVTANLILRAGVARAHLTPQTTLTLDEAGRIGVRVVDADGIARFTPVTIIEDSVDGVWVSGLPERARIIVRGQDYIADGVPVSVVEEGEGA